MRTSKMSSLAGLGRLALSMITILAIAGTLSACGRYGSPVRTAPVGDEAGVEAGSSAEVGEMDPESKGPAAEEESDRDDQDEDEDDLGE